MLVVGAGPAGLEAACALGKRGYRVTLAEAQDAPGGRINLESRLPGLSEWVRVRDWRLGQLAKMQQVGIYPGNRLDAESILELDHEHVIIATGAHWRKDGVGRYRTRPFSGHDDARVCSAEQIMRGTSVDGRVVIYDDDHYYLASALALMLRARELAITLVTPGSVLAGWNEFTDEHTALMRSLLAAGINIQTSRGLAEFKEGKVYTECVYSGLMSTLDADYLIPVTSRIPEDTLWQALRGRFDDFKSRGGKTLQRIGDCQAPGIIASAIYAGHKAARELGTTENEVKRDRVVV